MTQSGNNPLVSIIIPTYNATSYIEEAVGSALNQTYKNIEVVIVDDGSTDGTRSVLDPYIKEKKIIYVRQDNKGLAGARNTGMRAAHGEFIALLDSDDMFLPNKIERQVGYLIDHPECGVSYCNIAHFYEEEPEKLLKLSYEYYSGDEVFPQLLQENFINPLTVVLRRSAIDQVGLFDESYKRSEDWEYWVRLAYRGVRFCYVPEVLAKYRMRKTSLSYNWMSEVERKEKEVDIFASLSQKMSSAERKKYQMGRTVFIHRVKLWYARCGDYLPPLRWFHQWRQKKRLT
jgi:teichuronic acid biosynthesis glycosyltransferase TuaG